MEHGTSNDGKHDQECFQKERSRDPSIHSGFRVALGPGREELLIHALIADEKQHGWNGISECLQDGEVAEYLEVTRWETPSYLSPAPCLIQQQGDCNDNDGCDKGA